jgi:hypothetical protein
MHYWVVKGRRNWPVGEGQEENQWAEVLEPGRRVGWVTKRLPLAAAEGDRVFYWMAAPDTCVIALGVIRALSRDRDAEGLYHFTVETLTERFHRPLTQEELRRDPLLAGASFLKAGPAGTLFPLTESQARQLHSLAAHANAPGPEVWDWFPSAGPGSPSDSDDARSFGMDKDAFRADAAAARRVFEWLFPDERSRFALAEVLARSIREAHRVAPAVWGVTLFPDLIRLNVGMPNLLVLAKAPDKLCAFMAEDDGTLRQEVALRSPGAETWLGGRGQYRSLPTAVAVNVPPEVLVTLHAHFFREHQAAIAQAGRVQSSPQLHSHSPGVLKYLRQLGLDVPSPLHAWGGEAHLGQDVQAEAFEPDRIEDERRRILAELSQRQGQGAFRQQLLAVYEGRCAMTGCEVPWVLEAAHIVPYRGPETNHVTNGLLLRSDLHALFDIGLLRVDPHALTVEVDARLLGTPYAELNGRRLRLPSSSMQCPSQRALAWHAERSRAGALLPASLREPARGQARGSQ